MSSERFGPAPLRTNVFSPNTRCAPEEVKREGWRTQGVLVVSVDDHRLSWVDRELIEQIGDRLYGARPKPTRGR
jgi:hypothetical protein